jgi:hypothetical protein
MSQTQGSALAQPWAKSFNPLTGWKMTRCLEITACHGGDTAAESRFCRRPESTVSHDKNNAHSELTRHGARSARNAPLVSLVMTDPY